MSELLLRWVLLLGVLPTGAFAGGWAYHFSCSGNCAPDRLAISGYSAAYATQDQCESARSSDPRKDEYLASGNLGGLERCQFFDVPPAGSSDSPSQWSINPGITRVVGGYSFGAVNYNGYFPGKGWSGTLQVARGAREGAHSYFFLEASGITHDFSVGNTWGMTLLGGLEWSPLASSVIAPFFQIGAGLVLLSVPGSTTDNSWFGGKVTVGVEIGLGERSTHVEGSAWALVIGGTCVASDHVPALLSLNVGIAVR